MGWYVILYLFVAFLNKLDMLYFHLSIGIRDENCLHDICPDSGGSAGSLSNEVVMHFNTLDNE